MIAQFHHLLCCIKMLKVEAWILRAPPAKIPQTNSKQIFIDKVCKKKEFEISEACSLHHVGYCNTGWHNSSQTLLHQFLLHQLTTYWCFTFTVPCPAIPSVKCTPAPTHPHEQREENSSKISLCGRRMDLNNNSVMYSDEYSDLFSERVKNMKLTQKSRHNEYSFDTRPRPG